jgi:gas vesicle protein
MTMNRVLFFLYGLIGGIAAGFLFAPQSGRASRATIRDKSVKYTKDASHFTTGKAKHMSNKARGYAHGVKEAFGSLRGAEKDVASYI